MSMRHSLRALLAGLALSVACVAPSMADDTEIYGTSSVHVKPNILLIVDTSMSMGSNNITNERATYNSGTTYTVADNCKDGNIFFRATGEAMPECTSTNFISATSNKCKKLIDAAAGSTGRWSGKTAQWSGPSSAWLTLQPNGTTDPVECFADNAVHGETTSSTKKWARNGDSANKWTSSSSNVIAWADRPTYTFYSSNWLNWRRETPQTTSLTRMKVMQNAITDLLLSIDDVNIGMMRFNKVDTDSGQENQYSGGVVTSAIRDINAIVPLTTNSQRVDMVNDVNAYSANTATMLSEAFYEAGQYWGGKTPLFGLKHSDHDPDAVSSGKYVSPITHECQKNYTVILTDGGPTWDSEADDEISLAVSGSSSPVSCPIGIAAPGDTSIDNSDLGLNGRCLDDYAKYLYGADLSTAYSGKQNTITFTVAFGSSVEATTGAGKFLKDVGLQSGADGDSFNAADSDELQEALTNIANRALEGGSTFTSASVSVNAFNRATARSDVFFSLFNASNHVRWEGNLKKYKLVSVDHDSNATTPNVTYITGQGSTANAVDSATGFFRKDVQSYWSTEKDGAEVSAGGAASKLPDPAPRVIYTHIGSNPAGDTSNGTLVELDGVDKTVIGGKFNTTSTSTPTTAEVLDFAYAAEEKRMGDPLHSTPALVTYGGTAATPIDVVYTSTNDGFLHAVNAETGVEKWSFVPEELLARLTTLTTNPTVASRTYGLDGEIRVIRLDRDQDNQIEAADGDRVYLYFGMRRGGQNYYALDVTDRDSPKLLFKIGPSELPGVGETWSPPTIARVEVNGATQNAQRLVLVLGGGYDAAQENNIKTRDTMGNRIFIVDAKTGGLLWYASPVASADAAVEAKRYPMPSMGNSIPAGVAVIDWDNDMYADRMYAADTGGRIFRFDITRNKAPVDLVRGGLFARLGSGLADGTMSGQGSADDANTRRFYSAPDVALLQPPGAPPFYNIAIGSGYRGHPLSTATLDRFYSLRDKQPYASLDQSAYDTMTAGAITDGSASLYEVTDPATANAGLGYKGWKVEFGSGNYGNRPGEKVLAESVTGAGVLMFTTYNPKAGGTNCAPAHGNHVYTASVYSGGLVSDTNRDKVIDNKDYETEVLLNGILGTVAIATFRDNSLGDPTGGNTLCIAGTMVLDSCLEIGDSARDYWRRNVDQ